MNVKLAYPIFFSAFQLCWAMIWAVKHLRIRRLRRYADQRTQADVNTRYKVVSPLLYLVQNFLCIASFWSNSPLFLKLHDSNAMRLVGVLIVSLATVLYLKSLGRLGRNYSPCFDSYIPFELISSGPYRFTRHPMYAAKLIIVVGNLVMSGSLWFAVMFVYLLTETTRTITREERHLADSVPGYVDYQRRTSKIVPFMF